MFQNIDNSQFKKLKKEANTIVFDVRTPLEVAEAHIVGLLFLVI